MSLHPFGGLWTYPSESFPEHYEFMRIDEERLRIVLFSVLVCPPPKYGSMRHWYKPVSATTISARMNLKNAWRDHDFQLEGDGLIWTYGGARHPWRRVRWEDRPDWLDDRILAGYAKMDNAEREP